MNVERVFRILWGPTLENVLDFTFPVVGSSPTFSRTPRAGSAMIPNGSAAVSIITGRYYRLKVTAQYFGGQQNFGALGLQAFIDWASDSNQFTLVPNLALPTLTVTGCYLEGPFTQLSPSLEQDSTQTLELTVLHPTVDLGVAWRGLFFEYAAGQSLSDPTRFTYSRSSVGYEITPAGYLLSHPADSVCDGHYPDRVGGLQTTLVEATVNNDITFPEALDNAAWDKTTNVSVTANNAKAPDQAITADLVVENTTVAVAHVIKSATWAITNGDPVTGLALVRDGGRYRGAIQIGDDAGGNWVGVAYNLSTGTISARAEVGAVLTASKITPLAGGWFMLWWRGTCSTATTVRLRMLIQDGSGADTYTGDGASGTYLWGATAVHGADNMVASYTPTTSSADALLLKPFVPTPQAMWVYAKWVDQGGVHRPDGRLFNIGIDAFTAPYFGVQLSTTFGFKVISDMTGSNFVASTFAVGSFGDTHELLALLYSDASVQSVRAINGGAEVNGTRSAAGAAFAAAWSLAQFRFCGGNGSTGTTTNGIAVVRAGPLVVAPSPWAVQTIATARYT